MKGNEHFIMSWFTGFIQSTKQIVLSFDIIPAEGRLQYELQ